MCYNGLWKQKVLSQSFFDNNEIGIKYMSLQFIIGPSGSGKTTYMHRELTKRAAENPDMNYIILVPEQFNMQTQKDVVRMSPRRGILNVDVLSFTRLAHRIFDEAGGNDRHILDDTGKSMILRRVATSLEGELSVLAGRMDKSGYINEIKSVISEFMQYDIWPSELEDIRIRNTERPELAAKLSDLEKLYQGFIDYMGQNYITQEEILDRAMDMAPKARFLEQAEVYLDGYTGFTPVQIRFLKEIMKKVKRVTVTLTMGSEEIHDGCVMPLALDPEKNLFGLSYKTLSALGKIAEELGITVDEQVIMPSPGYRLKDNKRLSYLEENVFRSGVRPEFDKKEAADEAAEEDLHSDEALTITVLSDMRAEAAWTGRRIHELVREEGVRYRDIAILTGDMESYENILMTELVKYNIPVFTDTRHRISLNPFVEMIRAGVEIVVRNYSYDTVMRFLRSGMTQFSIEEVDELDNYIITAGIKKKKDYLREWTYVPRGMDPEKLVGLNEIRVRLVDILAVLSGAFFPRKKSACRDYVKALYEFIRIQGCYDRLRQREKRFEEEGDRIRAAEYSQIYEYVLKLFDRIMELMPGEEMTSREFLQVLDAGLSELTLGVLPQGTDQVIFGDMERSRLSEVKVLFLIGVNDGIIPKDSHKRGILSELDRRILKEQEIELAPGTAEQAFIQQFYMYMYLTKPSHRLYMSYTKVGADGASRMPSYLIGTIRRLLPDTPVNEIEDVRAGRALLTEGEGFDALIGLLRSEPDESGKRLFTYFMDNENYKDILEESLRHAFGKYEGDPIKASVAAALYGATLKGSVTRLEQFAQCAYMHFLNYGLKLREKREFAMEARDMGSVYHRALEFFGKKINAEGIDWFEVTPEKAREVMKRAVDDALAELADSPLYSGSRNMYLENRVRRIMDRTAETVVYQVQQGDFIPSKYEVRFEVTENLEEYDFARLKLSGSIDRMDTFKSDDDIFVKVVDYKSGNHKLDLVMVFHGVSLQLVVYINEALAAVKRLNPGKNVRNAGVLYYHIDDPIVDGEPDIDPDEVNRLILSELKTNGLLLKDTEVLSHMDRELLESGKSTVIPASLKKDGDFDRYSKVATTEELDIISDVVKEKVNELGGRIMGGEIGAVPYMAGSGSSVTNACRFCRYKDICGFDERMPGYRFNKLDPRIVEEKMMAVSDEAPGSEETE